MLISTSDLHPLKAPDSILFTDDGILIYIKYLHPLKTFLPIDFNSEGRVFFL